MPNFTKAHKFALGLCLLVALAPAMASADAGDRTLSQFVHTSWSARDGIPGQVSSIAQTNDGYLWLAAQGGLYRFNGIEFLRWQSVDQRLPDARVRVLLTSRDGTLWIGFRNSGVSRIKDGQVVNYPPSKDVPASIITLAEGSDGTIWAGGSSGFSRFSNGVWTSVGPESGDPAHGVQAFLVDRRGTLWVATANYNFGLSKDPGRQNTILSLSPGAKLFGRTGLACGQVWSMSEGPDGTIWYADTTANSIRTINGNVQYEMPGSPFVLLFDGDHSAWVTTGNAGILRTPDIKDGKPFFERLTARDGITSDMVYCAFRDREGTIWLGTSVGLERFHQTKFLFLPPETAKGLPPPGVLTPVSSSGHGVWAYYSGGYRFEHLESGAREIYRVQDGELGCGCILSMAEDKQGSAWVGGTFGLARKTMDHLAYIPIPGFKKGWVVRRIAVNHNGALWISVWTGEETRILVLQDGTWQDLSDKMNGLHYDSDAFFVDSNDRLWFGLDNGEIVEFDHGRIVKYSTRERLHAARILAFHEDRSGGIWISSARGLSLLSDGRFVTLTSQNGLPGDSIVGFFEASDNSVWIAGSMGVLHASEQELARAIRSPAQYVIKGTLYDARDGLPALPRPEVGAAVETANGVLWFGTGAGLASIDPIHFAINTVPPPVAIEAVTADDRKVESNPLTRIAPNSNTIEFDFAALSLTDPGRNLYRYRLEGFEQNWHGPTDRHQAVYTNLAPKEYLLRVVAANNDGFWNETGASLDFRVLPAWYQTVWFRAAAVVFVCLLLWTFYRLRLRQMELQYNARMEERLGERTRIARELHDTLLQSQHGLMLQFQAARNMLPRDPENAKRTLDEAIAGTEQAIAESRDAIHDLRSEQADIFDLPKLLEDAGEELRVLYAADQRLPTFQVIVEGEPHKLAPLFQGEVFRIALELMRNAYRHAGASQIEAEIRYEKRQFRLRIRDNGKGIDPKVLEESRCPGHWGLPGIRERTLRIRARLEVWSNPGVGTEFEIKVPAAIAYGATREGSRFKISRKETRS
ncbi:MAG: two-component regulator propeller domain-containing protein [Terracidiphilus sp.]|jgi:signal transduction histidine kinase